MLTSTALPAVRALCSGSEDDEQRASEFAAFKQFHVESAFYVGRGSGSSVGAFTWTYRPGF